jgi:diadenosine tetraphosphatase ApaH/serine/threonine PP2A family protein phosphatase
LARALCGAALVRVTAHRPAPPAPPQPFRWALSRFGGAAEARLGTLAGDDASGEPWHLPELTVCTGKVLARAHAADLCFVGRSLDSMYDLLTGALEDSGAPIRLLRLPLSGLHGRFRGRERRRLREHLAAAGLEPYALARRKRPVALADVVDCGGTFDSLHGELAAWIAESREPWPVIRRKLRYVGVTVRGATSPHHWRWQQSPESASWVRTLPAGHVVNVSLPSRIWTWYGDQQPKLHRAFPARRWFDQDATAPWHHEQLPSALRESLALVAAGRTRTVRGGLVRTLAAEPAFADREVRALAGALRGSR